MFKRAQQLIKNANKVVFFTGAGISVESGIPTFRGKDGTYTGSFIQKIGVFAFGFEWGWRWMPRIAFNCYKSYFLDSIISAKPNDSHYAIVDLFVKKMKEGSSKVFKDVSIITTNVDGLHKKAYDEYLQSEAICPKNDQKIREIHGNTLTFKCMKCERKFGIPEHPKCSNCKNGYVRPDVVFFKEHVKGNSLVEGFLFKNLTKEDVLVIVGASGTISREFPEMINAEVPVIEINIEEKPKFSKISKKHIYLKPKNTGKLLKDLCNYPLDDF